MVKEKKRGKKRKKNEAEKEKQNRKYNSSFTSPSFHLIHRIVSKSKEKKKEREKPKKLTLILPWVLPGEFDVDRTDYVFGDLEGSFFYRSSSLVFHYVHIIEFLLSLFKNLIFSKIYIYIQNFKKIRNNSKKKVRIRSSKFFQKTFSIYLYSSLYKMADGLFLLFQYSSCI